MSDAELDAYRAETAAFRAEVAAYRAETVAREDRDQAWRGYLSQRFDGLEARFERTEQEVTRIARHLFHENGEQP